MQRDLAGVVPHLGHEMHYVSSCALALWTAHTDASISPELRKSWAGSSFEALLLHLRNITEFLIPDVREDVHPDSVTCNNFLPTWACPEGSAKNYLKGRLVEIDRRLSHLSWERVGAGSRWNVGQHVFAARELIEVFIAALDAEDEGLGRALRQEADIPELPAVLKNFAWPVGSTR